MVDGSISRHLDPSILRLRIGTPLNAQIHRCGLLSLHTSRISYSKKRLYGRIVFRVAVKSALNGCNSHFHMYAKTPIRPLRGQYQKCVFDASNRVGPYNLFNNG